MGEVIAYKVFSAFRRYDSYILYSFNRHTLRQRYYAKKVNLPKFGNPIFAFATMDRATDFLYSNCKHQRRLLIARVEGEASDPPLFIWPGVGIYPLSKQDEDRLADPKEFKEWVEQGLHEEYRLYGPRCRKEMPFGTIGLSSMSILAVVATWFHPNELAYVDDTNSINLK